MVSRTGFTGDLGYELWVEPSQALELWDALFEKGALHGIRPMGTHALEVARIEAGFIQAQVDFLPGRPGDPSAIAHARRSSSISAAWSTSASPISMAVAPCSRSSAAAHAIAW